MKEKVVLIPIEELSYSQEIFLQEESKVHSYIIWIIGALFFAIGCWITFGKMEEVVKCKGIIKPITNISEIKNALSGEVDELNYYEGKEVQKGELLFKIKTDSLEAKEKSLSLSVKKLENYIQGLTEIQKSFYKNTVLIDKNNEVAVTRFNSFLVQKELLEKQLNYANTLLEDSLRLPKEAITDARIRELTHEVKLYSLNLENLKSSFIKEINNEKDKYIVELEEEKSNLSQIKQNIKNASVFASVSGKVHEVSSVNKDDFIFADKTILFIVPYDNGNYKAELLLPAKQGGKLEAGMKVNLRFPAFPFHEYGGSVGKIISISPNAEADEHGNLFFNIFSSVENSFLNDRKMNSYPIKSGLEVDGRIILKEEPILHYILKKLDVVW